MPWLRQSTTQTVRFGPFLDDTDGKTAETGLTVAQADRQISKDGGAFAQSNHTGNSAHDTDGWYSDDLDATDTNTLGELILQVVVAGALPVWEKYLVVPAVVYDAIVAGTDNLDINVAQWLGTAAATPTVAGVPEVDMTHLGGVEQSATDLKDFADAGYDPATNKVEGVKLVDTTTANTDMRGTDNAALASVLGALADAAAAGDPTASDTVVQYLKQIVNTLEGTTGIPTFPAAAVPANNVSLTEIIRQIYDEVAGLDGAVMRGTDGANTTTPPTAAAIADAVWDETSAGHTDAGKAGEQLWTDVDAILVDTAEIGSAVGASISADIAAVKAETALIVADTNELQTDDVPGLIAALNDISTAQVNTEVDNAIVTYGLDHLVQAAVVGADIADNSIIARMVSKSATADWDSFVNTTDSLEAISDTSSPSAATIADAVWDEAAGDHVAVGSFGAQCGTDIDAILVDTAEIGTAAGADIAADIAAVKAETALIVADTNELQTDWVDGGRLDLIVDAILVDTAEIGSAVGASISADIAAVKAETALIVADTNELQTDDVPGLIAALNDISTAQVNTEVDNAIVTYGLDHLVQAAVVGADIADNSIVAKIVSKSATADWDSFVNTTDSLEAISDTSSPSAATIADAVWDEAAGDHVAVGSFGAQCGTDIDAILVDTAEIGTAAGADIAADIAAVKAETALIVADTNELQTDWVDGGRLDLIVDAILVDTAEIGTATGADIAADIAAVKAETALIVADTNELQTDDVPGLIAALNDLSAAQINTEVDNAIVTYGLDHLVQTSVVGADIADNSIIARMVSKSATADWDSFVNTTDSLEAIADSSSTPPTAAVIADAVWDEAAGDHVGAGSFGAQCGTDIDAILVDTAEIGSAVGASISADIAAVKAETVLIVADTNELQTDWVDGGRLDLIVDAILVDTAEIGSAVGVSISADIAAVKAETALIVADTNELQTDWVDGGRLDLIVDAILVDTGTTLDDHLTDIKGTGFAKDTHSLTDIIDLSDSAVLENTTIATLATQVSFTLSAGSTDDDAYNGCVAVVTDASTAAQKAVGVISDYAGSTKTVTLLNDPGIFTMAATDKIAIIADRSLKSTVDNRTLDVTATGGGGIDWSNVEGQGTSVNLSATVVNLCNTITTYTGNTVQSGDNFSRLGAPAGASVSADIAAVKAETALIVADTNELQTDWVDGGRLDLIIDAILVDTAEIGSAAGADIAADIAAVKAETALIVADTNELQTDDVPGLIAALNNISAAQVNTEVDNAIVTYGLDHLVQAAVVGADIADNSVIARIVSKSATADWDSFVNTTDSLEAIADSSSTPPTAAVIADAVWDEATIGHTTAGTFGEQLKTDVDAILVDTAEIGTAAGADIAADIAAVKAETALIVADTNELQTDWVDGGRLDLIVDAILVDTAEIGTAAGADIAADIAAIKAETALIVADTNELQTDWVDGGRLDLIVDAILVDTAEIGTAAGADIAADIAAIKAETALIVADTNELQTDDVPGLIAALNDLSAAQVNTEVDNAIVTYGLDHLVQAAVVGADIADDSIIAKMVSKSATADWDSFVNTTDSLEAIADSSSTPPTAAVIADAVWDESTVGHTTAGTFGEQLKTDVDAILVDTAEIGTAAGADIAADIAAVKAETALIVADTNELQTDWVDGGRLDLIVDAILVDTAEIGSAAGADIAADIAAVKAETALIVADTNELQTDDVPGLIAALNDPTAAVIADAVWDEAIAGHVGAGSFGVQCGTDIDAILADTDELQTDDVPGLIAALNDLSAAQVNTEVDNAIETYGLDHLVQAAVVGADVADDSIIARIVSKSATADWDSFVNTTDSLEAIADSGGGGPTADQIADAVWDEATAGHTTANTFGAQCATDIDAILVDTNELQTDDVPGLIAALNDPTAAAIADAVWDESSAGHTDAGKAGAQLWTDIDAILVDTNELQTDGVPGLIAALNDPDAATIADAVWDENIVSTHGTADTAGLVLSQLTHRALATGWTTDVTANSVLDQLADDGTAAYDRTTDSLQAIADSGGGGPTADQIADAVWDEATIGHTTAGTFGEQLKTDVDAILVDTNELQTDDVPGLIVALNDPDAAAIADAVWDETSVGHTDAGKAGEQLWTDIDAVLVDTNELQTDDVPGLIAALNNPTAAAIADAVWDESTTGHVNVGTFGEQLKTDVDAILVDTDELQTDDVPGLIAALNDPTTASIADAVWDEATVGHTTAGTFGQHVDDVLDDVTGLNGDAMRGTDNALLDASTPANFGDLSITPTDGRIDVAAINGNTNAAVRLALAAGGMIPGTVDTDTFTPTTTQFEADDITEATADHFNGRVVLWTSGSLTDQATNITDYVIANGKGKFTVGVLTEAPGNNDTFVIV